MPPNIKVSVDALIAEAEREIETLAIGDAIKLHGRDDVVFIDIRDIRELARDGRMPGAFHCPRGMLEFWFDPASPYFRENLGDASKTYVLFCAAGWRSALSAKTLEDMGFENIAHVDGGFGALKAAGAVLAGPDPKNAGKI